MCTVMTHAAVALLAGGAMFAGRKMPVRFWIIAPICSMFPDMDTGLFAYGVAYTDVWGHRGMVHSPFFAIIFCAIVMAVFFRTVIPMFSRRWWGVFLFLTLITISHGVLDGFTNGGHGIAYFEPFSHERVFMPWTPIEVSAFGLRSMFTERGAATLLSELQWVIAPAVALTIPVALANWMMLKRRAAIQHT
jgi:inner membrane protein